MSRLVGASVALLIMVLLTDSFLAGPALFAAFENGHSVRVEEGQGMLFVFEKEGRHVFWMKNIHFSIDIIWVDVDLRIVDIKDSVLPCDEMLCHIYQPTRPALEVPAGYAAAQGLDVGQEVYLQLLSSGGRGFQ